MKRLKENVKNVWGEKGLNWLSRLPSIVEFLSSYWTLTHVKPVNNMNYNYVATALKGGSIPVVLKISCDKQLILDEYKALQHFDGHGAIKVLDINKEYNALLLKQAIPGCSLKEQQLLKVKNSIKIYTSVVKSLSKRPLPSNDYTHISKWCEALDRIEEGRIEKHFIDKAKKLRSFLLASAEQEYVCHGDLHLENIIQHGKQWLAIDPKGIIGEMSAEAAAFDLIDKGEIQDMATAAEKILYKITQLSTALNLDFDRLLSWIFVRVIISAQWFIEDGADPSETLNLADHLYSLFQK